MPKFSKINIHGKVLIFQNAYNKGISGHFQPILENYESNSKIWLQIDGKVEDSKIEVHGNESTWEILKAGS